MQIKQIHTHRTHLQTLVQNRLSIINTANPKKVNSVMEMLRCLGPKVWDMIPIKLGTIETLLLFKMKIKN